MKLSVIVCTRNRANALTDCLDAIYKAIRNALPIEAEIVVVDNNSTDDTQDVVKTWATDKDIHVNLVLETKKGLSAARNCGIKNARGDILAFTDDDCRPHPDYVKDILRYDDADIQPVLRGGRVELGDPTDLPLTIQTNPHHLRWYHPEASDTDAHLGGGIIPGCNMVMRREIVDKLGRFDEHMGAGTNVPAGEDTDYIFRAYMADFPVEYVPDMTVYHFHGRKDPNEARQLMSNYIVGTGALYAKHNFRHPNLRRKMKALLAKFSRRPAPTKETGSVMPETAGPLSGMDYSSKDKALLALRGAWLYSRAVMSR